MVDMNVLDEKVIEVAMMRHKTHGMGHADLTDLEIFFRVRLRSLVKPGFISFLDVDARNSEDQAKQAVMVAAGALAEHQCKTYLDVWDPNDIASLAGEAFTELMSDVRARAN